MKLVSVPEMQKIEREADASGLSYAQMMEHAGRNLAEEISDAYSWLDTPCVIGLVGSGNNGGDTLVALAYLLESGWDARAYLVRPRPADDPLIERFTRAGGSFSSIEDDSQLESLKELLDEADVLVDGVLGTGIRLPLQGDTARVLDTARQVVEEAPDPPYVVAVDCPSGMDSDTGQVASETIPANITVTMAAVKTGMLSLPAYQKLGDLRVVGIGLPEEGGPQAWQDVHRRVIEEEWVCQVLPQRPMDAHKGTFGTALVVAGSTNFSGAALLAGAAAYRVGAGLVTLAVPAPVQMVLAGHIPEATWVILPHDMGVIARNAVDVLRKNLERVTALLIGPGFGQEDTTKDFIDRLLGGTKGGTARSGIGFIPNSPERKQEPTSGSLQLPPLVIDADGLKLLAKLPDWQKRLPEETILTPHPGEMAILSGLEKEEIQADRIGTAERFAREWGYVVVLKGAFTVIASPDGRTSVIPVASAALARAGTGDVLAGAIAGLRAQGLSAYEAAAAGAWIHAQAGLRAAETTGSLASVLAGDVLFALMDVLADLEPEER